MPGGRLGHEGGLDAQLAGDLLADLPVGDQPVGGEVGVVVHPVQLDLALVLVVALDHVQAERLGVGDDLLDDRPVPLEVLDVVRRAGLAGGSAPPVPRPARSSRARSRCASPGRCAR